MVTHAYFIRICGRGGGNQRYTSWLNRSVGSKEYKLPLELRLTRAFVGSNGRSWFQDGYMILTLLYLKQHYVRMNLI